MKIYPTSFTRELGGLYSSSRPRIIRRMLEKVPAEWSDFVKLEALLAVDWNRGLFSIYSKGVDGDVINAMHEIVQRITPQPLDYLLSESNLYEAFDHLRMIDGSTTASWHPSNSQRIDCSDLMYTAAETIQIILEKIGDSMPDETKIIESFLFSEACTGTQLVLSTSKHGWRYSSEFRQKLIHLMNRKYNDGSYVLSSESRKKIKRGLVSADPNYLFSKYSDVDEYITYEGKDPEMEKILIECAKENDSNIRAKAFGTIGQYLQLHDIDNSSLDEVLIKGIENRDVNALFAVLCRLKRGPIRDHRIFPLLLKSGDDTDWERRRLAFAAVTKYLNQENKNTILPQYESQLADTISIISTGFIVGKSLAAIAEGHSSIETDQIKSLARRHFNDEDEDVRISATNLFGIVLVNESKLTVEDSDISTLIAVGQNDSNEIVRSNATYALSVIIVKNLNRLTIPQQALVQALCTRFEGYEGASESEREMISQALTILERKADRRKSKVVRSIRDPKVAKEAGDLFELDKIVISELKQKVQGFREELAEAKEEIQSLRRKNAVLRMSVSQKRTLIKKVITKLRDANSQIEKLKSRHAKRQAARLILTCAGLAAPHFHLLGLSADLANVAESASKYVEIATLPKALKDLIHQN